MTAEHPHNTPARNRGSMLDRALLHALIVFLALTIAGCQAHAVWWLLQP